MSDATKPTNENAAAEPRDSEGLDAAAEAFAKLNEPEQTQQPQPEEEADPDDGSNDESDTEAEEAEPEAEEAEDEAVEVEFEGKTYKVPPELEKALLRQSDYSRAMNEVTAKEKTYTQRLEQIEAITEGADKYAEALSGVRIIEAQLAQFEGIDWNALGEQNPGEAARLAVRQLQLQQQLTKASQDAETVGKTLQDGRAKLIQQARADMFQTISKTIKGWGDEMGQKLTEYAVKNGVSFKTLAETTDPGVVIALDKARRFDELQASKSAIKAKGQGAPIVTKPGAPRRADPRSDAMKAHQKSGSIDSAAAAFLAIGR